MQEKHEIPINITTYIKEDKNNDSEDIKKLLFHYSQNAVDFQKSVIQSLFLFNGALATALFASKNENLFFPSLWFAVVTMLSILAYMVAYSWQVSSMSEVIHGYKYKDEEKLTARLYNYIKIICLVSFVLSGIGIIITWICLWK